MGQKVNPLGLRTGVYRGWNSRWYARDSYADYLLDDLAIRDYIEKHLKHAEIDHVEVDRAGENVRVVLYSARPGIVIGRKGQEIDALRRNLARHLGVATVEVSVQEVKKPEISAEIVAQNIADQIERRANFKKVMKKVAMSAMRAGARGIKIRVAGRVGGAEIARAEWVRVGSVPLHTLRSDIEYSCREAMTTYGIIGIKVWICKGDFKAAS